MEVSYVFPLHGLARIKGIVERDEEEGKSGQVFNSGGRSPLMRSLLVRKEERTENTPDGYDTSG